MTIGKGIEEAGTGETVGSIVIPAWNEAAVIEKSLSVLFDGLCDDDQPLPHVVLACNGCSDGTPDIARNLGYPLTVLDLPVAGKAGAIIAAETVAPELPRLYLDAGYPDSRQRAVFLSGSGYRPARPRVFANDIANRHGHQFRHRGHHLDAKRNREFRSDNPR